MTAALAVVAPRIGQLIRLLGSDRDGEVIAAARALGRTLASVGEDFHTLADTIERSAIVARSSDDLSPAAHRGCDDHRAMARWLLNSGARLSPKEFAFVADMANRFGSLSTRQEAWLQAIYERVSAQSRRA
jgi:hypothetical protein